MVVPGKCDPIVCPRSAACSHITFSSLVINCYYHHFLLQICVSNSAFADVLYREDQKSLTGF